MEHSDHRHFTAEDQRAVDGVSDVIAASVINPRSMLPAYLQLAIYLRGAIIVRQLPPGAPLPSEPELCERYKVSRDTVRRSIQVLREIGLAETRRGVGHFVTRTPEIRRVVVAPGTRVIVRMPQPHEQGELLGLTVFVVTEPGKPPVAYDTAQTVLVFLDEDSRSSARSELIVPGTVSDGSLAGQVPETAAGLVAAAVMTGGGGGAVVGGSVVGALVGGFVVGLVAEGFTSVCWLQRDGGLPAHARLTTWRPAR